MKYQKAGSGSSSRDSSGKSGKGVSQGKTGAPGRGSGTVRIISGRFRGRRLPVLDSEGLRPTTDRVRETVFNWLMFRVAGSSCLDMFAGSGGLGFEAWSRGARRSVLLEKNHQVFQNLKRNAELLAAGDGAGGPEVIEGDALSWVRSYHGEPFDIVFLDPPFRKGMLEEALALLPGLVRPDGFVYVEQESEAAIALPGFLRPYREGRAGQVVYRLFQMAAEGPEKENQPESR